jgi:hypothetical protein
MIIFWNNFKMSELFQIFFAKLREKNIQLSEKSNFKRFEPKLAEILRVQDELSLPSRNSHKVGNHRRFFMKINQLGHYIFQTLGKFER